MPDTQTSPRLSKDIDDIRAGLFSRIEQVQDEYAAKGWLPARMNLNKGVVRGIIELFAWGLWQVYTFLSIIHQQAIPRSSTGEWLGVHATQVDLTRKPATKARGSVLFLRGEQTGNVRIPAGRILRTPPDGAGNVFRYVTEELAVLPEGAASVSVPVAAEEYGQGSNAAAGQICELVTPVTGISGVTNSADWLTEEGADEEGDAGLQLRYTLAWKSQAGVTRAAYEKAALSVPGVLAVYVSDQHPRGEGTVDVVVQGSAGIPTAKLLEKVREALEDSIVINHDLQVKAPTPVNITVKAVLEILSGDEKTIKEQAEATIRKMFSFDSEDDGIPRFSLGKDVVRDRLASGIINISNVKRIRWESPSGDVVIAPDALPVLAELDLQIDWVDQA
ncbi:baseplate J/gp47 family protein [Bilophila wadsworthia]|uniref:baseplate J/gp47 family protein n=1 Tax=Bilophila wadsworthia TaxID=35833 RepID=UPI00266EA6D2|nr:baseplate J/gp47 family protein [Bilophila wadsworthia]